MHRFAVVLCFTYLMLSSQAFACTFPPGSKQSDEALRSLINDADHVFVGVVERIKRRRWGPDDELGVTEKLWMKRKKAGRKVDGYIQNMLDFSDATARIFVDIPLKVSSIAARPRGNDLTSGRPDFVSIDLLTPFNVAGHGPCHNFPQTCAWDTKSGDRVAIAVNERRHPPWSAEFCLKIEAPDFRNRKHLKSKIGSLSAAEVIWPFIEAAKLRAEKLGSAERRRWR